MRCFVACPDWGPRGRGDDPGADWHRFARAAISVVKTRRRVWMNPNVPQALGVRLFATGLVLGYVLQLFWWPLILRMVRPSLPKLSCCCLAQTAQAGCCAVSRSIRTAQLAYCRSGDTCRSRERKSRAESGCPWRGARPSQSKPCSPCCADRAGPAAQVGGAHVRGCGGSEPQTQARAVVGSYLALWRPCRQPQPCWTPRGHACGECKQLCCKDEPRVVLAEPVQSPFAGIRTVICRPAHAAQ